MYFVGDRLPCLLYGTKIGLMAHMTCLDALEGRTEKQLVLPGGLAKSSLSGLLLLVLRWWKALTLAAAFSFFLGTRATERQSALLWRPPRQGRSIAFSACARARAAFFVGFGYGRPGCVLSPACDRGDVGWAPTERMMDSCASHRQQSISPTAACSIKFCVCVFFTLA